MKQFDERVKGVLRCLDAYSLVDNKKHSIEKKKQKTFAKTCAFLRNDIVFMTAIQPGPLDEKTMAASMTIT